MNDSGKIESVLLTLCTEILKKLSDHNTRKDGIKEVLEIKFETKMSEDDYIHYMFFKALGEMYKAGLEEGENGENLNTERELNEEKSIVYFRARSSKRSIPADNFAMKLAPVLREIRKSGPLTLLEIAEKLTEMGITTIAGGKWHPATVRSLENRIEKIANKTAEWNVGPNENSNRKEYNF